MLPFVFQDEVQVLIEGLKAAVEVELGFGVVFEGVKRVELGNIVRDLFFSFDVDNAIESLAIAFFESFGVVVNK